MRAADWTILLLLTLVTAGCRPGGTDAPTSVPLTMEQWRALPAERKYEIDALERLKLGEPKLQEQREWDRFTRTALIPGRKKEGTKGTPGK